MAGPGKVDYDNLLQTVSNSMRRIRWRMLCHRQTNTKICIYGYSALFNGVDRGGPWFGYDKPGLALAPCLHCGALNVFDKVEWKHWCTRRKLPCGGEHWCYGEPSMEGAPLWRHTDWIELPLMNSDAGRTVE